MGRYSSVDIQELIIDELLGLLLHRQELHRHLSGSQVYQLRLQESRDYRLVSMIFSMLLLPPHLLLATIILLLLGRTTAPVRSTRKSKPSPRHPAGLLT